MQTGQRVATFRHVLTHRVYAVDVFCHELTDLAQTAINDPQRPHRWLAIDQALGKAGGVSRLGQRAIELAVQHIAASAPRDGHSRG